LIYLHIFLPPRAASQRALAKCKVRTPSSRETWIGVTRVRASDDHAGSLYLTYPNEMYAGTAKQLDIPYTKESYGQAQLTPSVFLQELGPAAPAPVVGKV
jgi:DNA helicase-2/ATP-dependent DNA helicase PcrA